MLHKTFLLALALFATRALAYAANPDAPTLQPANLTAVNDAGRAFLAISEWPKNGELPVTTPVPNITRTYLADDRERKSIPFVFNDDASKFKLLLAEKPTTLPANVMLETAEKSAQFPDGRIVFSALDAVVKGKVAKLETHPGNHRIGYWSDKDDSVEWIYKATRPGNYTAELTYSVVGGGNECEVAVGYEKLAAKLPDTGNWYKYTTLVLGAVRIAAPGDVTVSVRGTRKESGAVMNFKALTLRPASEGQPIKQADDGTITCHARDVIIHGTKVQWEPKPEKQTVGYWVNVGDTVAWEFTATKAGEYEVEILQGCGKGQGGSEVELSVAGQPLKFTVEDTGHFQNFVARKIGRMKLDKPGVYDVTVKPLSKKAGAIMDLRQVRLVPVSP